MTNRVLIWDVPTRLFHWLLAGGFLTAFAMAQLSDDEDTLFPYHAMSGVVLGVLVVLRIVWGLVGTRYARFSSFLFKPSAVFLYLRNVPAGSGDRHLGHNPASSYAIFAMLALVLIIVSSGLLRSSGEVFEEAHEVAAYALITIAGLHVIGVLLHTIRYRENITASMVTGRKKAEPEAAIGSSKPLVGIVLLLLVAFLAGSLYRDYDPIARHTHVPGTGATIQLGEVGEEGKTAESSNPHRHDDDD